MNPVEYPCPNVSGFGSRGRTWIIRNSAPLGPCSGLCLGPYGGPKGGGAVFYERAPASMCRVYAYISYNHLVAGSLRATNVLPRMLCLQIPALGAGFGNFGGAGFGVYSRSASNTAALSHHACAIQIDRMVTCVRQPAEHSRPPQPRVAFTPPPLPP